MASSLKWMILWVLWGFIIHDSGENLDDMFLMDTDPPSWTAETWLTRCQQRRQSCPSVAASDPKRIHHLIETKLVVNRKKVSPAKTAFWIQHTHVTHAYNHCKLSHSPSKSPKHWFHSDWGLACFLRFPGEPFRLRKSAEVQKHCVRGENSRNPLIFFVAAGLPT